jgi:hypothetical protein
MQKKLTKEQWDMCRQARDAIASISWENTERGARFWKSVYDDLIEMQRHGTTDGKPWAEKELTDEDAKQRPWVMVRDSVSEPWRGPKVLAYVEKDAIGFRKHLDTAGAWWGYARKATTEEIPAHTQERTK